MDEEEEILIQRERAKARLRLAARAPAASVAAQEGDWAAIKDDPRLNLLTSLKGGVGLNRAREAGILNHQGTVDAPPLRAPGPVAPAPSLMDDPLGAKSFGNWAAYQAERGMGFLHGVGISASVPLVGAVYGTGGAEYQAERAKMAFEGDPDLANWPSRDELLESVPFSGAPGMDPAVMMQFIPRIVSALSLGRRLTVAERESLMLRKVELPEGTGSVTKVTPDGQIRVTIPGKGDIETTIPDIREAMTKAWKEQVPKELAGPMDPIVSRETLATGQPATVKGYRAVLDPEKVGSDTGMMAFATDPEGAGVVRGYNPGESATDLANRTSAVIATEVNLKNPFVFEGGDQFALAAKVFPDVPEGGIDKALGKWAEENGYDGIVYLKGESGRPEIQVVQSSAEGQRILAMKAAPALRGADEAVSTASKGGATVPPASVVPAKPIDPPTPPPPGMGGMGPVPKGPSSNPAINMASKIWDWIRDGKKGYEGGPDFAKATQKFQRQSRNVKELRESTATSIDAALKQVSENYDEISDAYYAYHFHGVPIPDELSTKYAEGLAQIDRFIEFGQTARMGYESEAQLAQYPAFLRRMVKEKKPGGGSALGIDLEHNLRSDAFISEVKGLNLEEAKEFINKLPEELRPLQPDAPGASKGILLEGETPPEWVGEAFGKHGTATIKWPNTPDGKKGRQAFEDLVKGDPVARNREIAFTRVDPIPLEESEQFHKDLPTVVSRTIADEARRLATHEYLGSIPGMQDANGPLTVFMENGDIHKGLHKEVKGFTLIDGGDKSWGPLNSAVQDGKKGAYLVRDDVAQYLLRGKTRTDGMAGLVHGYLDAQAMDLTNWPTTGFGSILWNKVVLEPQAGVFPGTRAYQMGTEVEKAWAKTRVIPRPELEQAILKGFPIQPPESGVGAFVDEVELLLDAEGKMPANQSYETGRRLYQMAGASPLNPNVAERTLGGAAQGAVKAAVEGDNPLMGTVLGALESNAAVPFARGARGMLINGDQRTTLRIFYKFYNEAIDAGKTMDEAVDFAIEHATPLTQAGQWGKVGGASELFGGANPELMPSRSGWRAAQRFVGNRFITFPEVATRNVIAGGNEAISRIRAGQYGTGIKTAIFAGLGLAAFEGAREGLGEAGVQLGSWTREQKKKALSDNPTSLFFPAYSVDQRRVVQEEMSGRYIEHPLMGVPTSTADALSAIKGPGADLLWDAAQFGFGVTEPKSMTGVPLQKQRNFVDHEDPRQGTMETPAQSMLRIARSTGTSPWSYGGRGQEAVTEDAAAWATGLQGAPTPGEVLARPLLGKIREYDPEAERKALVGGFHAQASEIIDKGSSLGRRAERVGIPGDTKRNIDTDTALRLANLMEDYIRRGAPQAEVTQTLDRKKGLLFDAAKRILINRGVLPNPAQQGFAPK